jgi:hypothetical protein
MPIGTSKVGLFGGKPTVLAGCETFNSPGTFTVPEGLEIVSVTGRGASGNPGNSGNNGGSGAGGNGGGGGCGLLFNGRAGGSGGNSQGGGNPGSPGNAGNPSTALCFTFTAGNGGTGGTGGNAGSAGNPGGAGNPSNPSTSGNGGAQGLEGDYPEGNPNLRRGGFGARGSGGFFLCVEYAGGGGGGGGGGTVPSRACSQSPCGGISGCGYGGGGCEGGNGGRGALDYQGNGLGFLNPRNATAGGNGNQPCVVGGGGGGGGSGPYNNRAGAGGGGGGGAGGAGNPGNPGNPGNSGTPSTQNCVPVVVGCYPIVVPTNGQVVISWNTQKELDRRNKLRQLENLEANDSRAQSITVGTAGGGTTEITMRSASGKFLWNTYQPVEVIELIHQLSANVGCHLQLVPRQDFAAWRDWKVSDEELAKARGIQHTPGVGFSPFPKYDAEKYLSNGANLPHPDEQVGRQKIEVKEQENVATKKAVNKRSTKRSRTTTK